MIAVNKSDMKYWEAMCKEKGINPTPLKEGAGVVFFDNSAMNTATIPAKRDLDTFAVRLKAADDASRETARQARVEASVALDLLVEGIQALTCGHNGSARNLITLAIERGQAALKYLPK